MNNVLLQAAALSRAVYLAFPVITTIFWPLFLLYPIFLASKLREDIKKKTADLVKIALLGGRGSEKLLNFHHLQMMKNMEGGRSQSNISLLHRTQL